MKHKTLLIIIYLALVTSTVYAVNFGGTLNYQTPSLGIVHFSANIVASQWDTWNSLTRFQNVIWNGNNRGTLAVDVSNGDNVTFTGLQANTLIYNVASAGAATQTIYYRGLGMPSEIVGGTFVMNGDNVVVTTAGNTVVTITWNPNASLLGDQLMLGLGVLSLVPLCVGAFGLQAVMQGNMSQDEFSKIAMAVAGSVITIFVIALIVNRLYVI